MQAQYFPTFGWKAILILALAIAIELPAAEPAAKPAAEPPRQERIDRLIEQLGDAQYDVRQQAQDELAKLGFEAFDALTVAENHKDLEIAARARYLLRLLQVDLTDKNDPPEVAACLENYPFLPMREQQLRMRRLAALPEGQGIPALCRLVRFERSAVRSKHAAVEILRRKSSEKPDRAEVAKVLRDSLQHSRRPASRWLLVWAGYTDNPQAALAEWKAAIHQEEAALDGDNPDTDQEIIGALVLQQNRVGVGGGQQSGRGGRRHADPAAAERRRARGRRGAGRLGGRAEGLGSHGARARRTGRTVRPRSQDALVPPGEGLRDVGQGGVGRGGGPEGAAAGDTGWGQPPTLARPGGLHAASARGFSSGPSGSTAK